MRNRVADQYADAAPDYGTADDRKRLWLIDGAYLFSTQSSVAHGYNFDYLLLKTRLEQSRTSVASVLPECIAARQRPKRRHAAFPFLVAIRTS